MPAATLVRRPTSRGSRPRPQSMELGPRSAGIRMTAREFDAAVFDENWRYELIDGVLVVSPIPFNAEVDPNEELGRLLRNYQESHPSGAALNRTLYERHVNGGPNRRRVDRLIWAGLGRLPKLDEPPTIVVEFVSKAKRSHLRDYEEKRREYEKLRIPEYWVFNRFEKSLTVFVLAGTRYRKQVLGVTEKHSTPLLPGFEVPIARLLKLANRWGDEWEV